MRMRSHNIIIQIHNNAPWNIVSPVKYCYEFELCYGKVVSLH